MTNYHLRSAEYNGRFLTKVDGGISTNLVYQSILDASVWVVENWKNVFSTFGPDPSPNSYSYVATLGSPPTITANEMTFVWDATNNYYRFRFSDYGNTYSFLNLSTWGGTIGSFDLATYKQNLCDAWEQKKVTLNPWKDNGDIVLFLAFYHFDGESVGNGKYIPIFYPGNDPLSTETIVV